MNIDYESHQYYPTLRTRKSELLGLKELSEARKQKILPLLTLGCWRNNIPDPMRSIEEVHNAIADQPYICDLTTKKSHLSEPMRPFQDPTDGYKAWRQFVQQSGIAVPACVLSATGKVRDFVKQASLLERRHRHLAFRIRNPKKDGSTIIAALSALDDAHNAIVFVDAGHIRNEFDAYVGTTINSINEIRQEFPEVNICALSSTFPASVIPFSANEEESWGLIPSQEHTFHKAIGGSDVAIYGDYGSIHAAIYDDAGIRRWSPRIDVPRIEECYFERRPLKNGSEQGYVASAKEILRYVPSVKEATDIWGAQMITEAARASLFGKDAASWIAVRVNIHLSRQIDHWAAVPSVEPPNFDQEFRTNDPDEDI